MTSSPSPNGVAPSPAVVRAIRRVLRPLVRLMLAGGVTYPIVSDLLKSVFVQVADREFRIDDKKPTDSRITLITGVHRKDVRRLRDAARCSADQVPRAISFGGQLIATWLGDDRFLDEQGQSRALPRTPGEDGRASFADLVASHSTDLRPRVVLDEWLRLGLVRVDDQDRVALNTEAFIPTVGLEEKLYFFAHNLHDHAAAATDNLIGSGAAQLERSVMYDNLSAASIEQLDRRARQLGMKLLKELNRLAMERDAIDASSPGPRRRFTCGVYFHSEPDPKDSPAGSAQAAEVRQPA